VQAPENQAPGSGAKGGLPQLDFVSVQPADAEAQSRRPGCGWWTQLCVPANVVAGTHNYPIHPALAARTGLLVPNDLERNDPYESDGARSGSKALRWNFQPSEVRTYSST